MRKAKIWTYSLWAASVLWLGLCLFLSWQPGEDTAHLSGNVAQIVERIIHVFAAEVDLNVLHAWLRKAAHVAMFFVLGLLFFCSFQRSLKHGSYTRFHSFALSAALCSLCATAAEICKIWIPGRHLQWDEALLNVIGVVGGAGLAALMGIFFASLAARKR